MHLRYRRDDRRVRGNRHRAAGHPDRHHDHDRRHRCDHRGSRQPLPASASAKALPPYLPATDDVHHRSGCRLDAVRPGPGSPAPGVVHPGRGHGRRPGSDHRGRCRGAVPGAARRSSKKMGCWLPSGAHPALPPDAAWSRASERPSSQPVPASARQAWQPGRAWVPQAWQPGRAWVLRASRPGRASVPQVSQPVPASAPQASRPGRASAPQASRPAPASAPRAWRPGRASVPQAWLPCLPSARCPRSVLRSLLRRTRSSSAQPATQSSTRRSLQTRPAP